MRCACVMASLHSTWFENRPSKILHQQQHQQRQQQQCASYTTKIHSNHSCTKMNEQEPFKHKHRNTNTPIHIKKRKTAEKKQENTTNREHAFTFASSINAEIKNQRAKRKKKRRMKEENKTTTATTQNQAKRNQNRNGKMHGIPFHQKKITFHSFVCSFHSCHFFSIHFSFEWRSSRFCFFSLCACVCACAFVFEWGSYRLSSSLNRIYPPALTPYFIFAILHLCAVNTHTHTPKKFVPCNLKRFL